MAQALNAEGEATAAAALLRRVVERNPKSTAAPNAHAGAMQRAQALLAAGDAVQADRIFASVLAEEVRGDLRILQQRLMFRHVHSHIKLAYKSTPSYWNAYDGAVPAPIRDVLSQIVA